MDLLFDKTDEKYKIMKIGKANLDKTESFIPIENPLKKYLNVNQVASARLTPIVIFPLLGTFKSIVFI